jgi:hypothetical protein
MMRKGEAPHVPPKAAMSFYYHICHRFGAEVVRRPYTSFTLRPILAQNSIPSTRRA